MKTWIVGLGAFLLLVGFAAAINYTPLDAVLGVGKVSYPGVVDLRGTSPDVFNYSQFQQPDFKHRGLVEWTSGGQGYDYEDFPWSIRDFLVYEKPL